jgi:hypothetical protein
MAEPEREAGFPAVHSLPENLMTIGEHNPDDAGDFPPGLHQKLSGAEEESGD